jgi:hypothetical protein
MEAFLMIVKQANTLKSAFRSAPAQDSWSERRYVLRFAAVHEDCLPWEWTAQVYQRAVQLVGQRCVHVDCWTVDALSQPPVLQSATAAAIEADILSLAVCATREFPLNLYRWLDSWLPDRPHRTGALVAILGVPQQHSDFPARIREYLRDVARLAHLDFLSRERRLPKEYSDSAVESATNDLQEISPLLNPVQVEVPLSSFVPRRVDDDLAA